MGKPTEVQVLRLRQPSLNEPAELVVGDSKSLAVFLLRPSQLKQLAYDAVTMALKVKLS